MKKFILVVVAGVLVAALGGYVFRAQIVYSVWLRVLDQMMQADPIGALDDGLHVALCGAGGPMGSPGRSGPCVAVVADKKLLIFDTGSGAARQLGQMQLPPAEVSAVFLTHFHSDHIDGLGELALQRWAGGARQTAMPVYGPVGVGAVVDGFNSAYLLDKGYRIAHHGVSVVPPSGFGAEAIKFEMPKKGAEVSVYKSGSLEVLAYLVAHSPVEPAVGYIVTYKDRKIVISGDTNKQQETARVAKGADVLLHEALSARLVGDLGNAAKKAGRDNLVKITIDILDYHATPVEAAELAEEAGVKFLLYYHIVPPLPLRPLEGIFLDGVSEAYKGKYAIGRDGTMLSLPAGSDRIVRSNRL